MINFLKINFCIVLLLSSCINLFGQEVLPKRLKKLKRNSRTFIFAIPSHLSNRKYPTHKDQASFEEKLTFIISKYWYLEEAYRIMPEEEANQFAKQNKDNVFLLTFNSKFSTFSRGLRTDNSASHGGMVTENLGEFGEKPKKAILGTAEKGRVNVLREKDGSIEIFLPNILSKVDFVFAINQLQFFYKNAAILRSYLGFKESAHNYGKLLKSKTLLIPENALHKKVTLAAVKKIYPYKYEFVSQEKINRAIISKDSNYLTIYGINPVGSTAKGDMRLWLVYDPETGAIVSYARNSFRYPMLPPLNPLPHELNLKSFKRILKNMK